MASGRTAAEATLLATRYNAETVRTVLAAQVAIDILHAARHSTPSCRSSRDTLVTRVDSVKLQKQRYDAGLISEYELQLAQAERASVAASIPPLERAIAQTEAALATLAGRSARAVFTPMIARGGPDDEAAIGPRCRSGCRRTCSRGGPTSGRPKRNSRQPTPASTEARAQYFPSLLLTGVYGSESSDLSNLFSGPAVVWSIAGVFCSRSLTEGASAPGRCRHSAPAAARDEYVQNRAIGIS